MMPPRERTVGFNTLNAKSPVRGILCTLLFIANMSVFGAEVGSSGSAKSDEAIENYRRQFFASSRETVLKGSRVPARGAGKTVDSAVVAAMRLLTSADEPVYLDCRDVDVHVVEGGGSQFHPDAGILVDEVQIKLFQKEVPAASIVHSVLFVVAHECAHARQFKQYSEAFMTRAGNTKFLECQADLLAGVAIGRAVRTPFIMQGGAFFPLRLWVLSMDKLSPEEKEDMYETGNLPLEALTNAAKNLSNQEASDYELVTIGGRDWSRLARFVGTAEWHDPTKHPIKSSRMQSALDGLYAGLYLKHVDKALETGAPAMYEFVKTWRDNYVLRPQLPAVGDDVFEWSKRSAEEILAEETDILGQSKE